MEDAAFKSDWIVLGNDVTVGAVVFMNYGVVMGDGSILEPDSFLMKGEQVGPNTIWGGNPARQMGVLQ
jgi:acetyltransferase-like isoleucine patch superfamily enzyme